MAKFPVSFDLRAFEIRSMIEEGRHEDAKTALVDLLLTGTAGKQVQAIAAEFLKHPRRKVGGQKKSYPAFWKEIAGAFHEAVDGGLNHLEAREVVAERYGYSASHVKTCVRLYDTAVDASRAE